MARNFIFMQNKYPAVYDALEKAEECAYSDPHNSVIKCGIAAEMLTENIFKLIGKEIPAKNRNFSNLIYILKKDGVLSNDEFSLVTIIDNIKNKRNKAAHRFDIVHQEAIIMLNFVYAFCLWFYNQFIEPGFRVQSFTAPAKPLGLRVKEFFGVGAAIGVCLGSSALLRVAFPTLSIALDLTNIKLTDNGEVRIALKPEVRRGLENLNRKFLNA